MKEYIVLTIDKDTLFFNFRTIKDEENKFINRLEFYNASLYFSLKYYKKNYSEIIKLLKDKNTEVLTIKRLITFKYSVYLLTGLNIKKLRLDFPSTVSLQDYEMFLEVDTLKEIDCYYMPKFIVNKFNKKGVNVTLYNKEKVSDRFMLMQDAFDYETLYYKKNIEIREKYDNLVNDIREFLRINYNLKSIHLYVFSKELISSIMDLIKNDESREIIVFLHQGYDEYNFISKNFLWLKEINKKCKNEYTCEFRIVYSNSFLVNNLFKQLTFNNLKLISLLCIYVSLVSLIIIKSYEYVEKMSIDEINAAISNGTYGNDFELDRLDDGIEDDSKNNTSSTGNSTSKPVSKKYQFEKVFAKLKKINNETVGFLTVNGTNINYPIVQHNDNSYYLKRDIYKKKSSMGWVYLDYRNSKNEFDSNNIIYGHSMLNGTMFGTLKNVLTSNFRKNSDNMIISYDTPNGQYKFKIFSGYRVKYTTDYLKTDFENKKEFAAFVKLIKGRSTFKTSDKIEYGDKILTLSTCANNGKRLVVHAVLIKE